MFEGWENYYLMVGSAAGALIGLMFVVVTLTAGRGRSELDLGKRFYTSPIVWHLAVILTLSGIAAIPHLTARPFGVAIGAAALLGLGIGLRSAIGIARWPSAPDSIWFDMFWYGVAPTIAYVGLAVAAVGVFEGRPWGEIAVALDLMALLLVSIHAEWDLVTYLAPEAGQPSERRSRKKD
jgi:hypothetical protein